MSKAKSVICAYGESGAGKTTLTEDLAIYVYNKTGKKTRLVSRSGGGWESIQPAVDAGLVIPLDITDYSDRFRLLSVLTQGWWPADPDDPSSPLLPPPTHRDRWPNVKKFQLESEWDDIGAYVFDGKTELAEWLIHELRDISAEKNYKFWGDDNVCFSQEGMKIASVAGGMYGMIQKYFSQYVAQTKGLSSRYVLWTALEDKGEDEQRRAPIYGPKVIGSALTADCPAWYEQVLHLMRNSSERQLWFEEHLNPKTKIPWKAKNTAHHSATLASLNGGKEYVEGENLLGQFLTLLERSRTARSARLAAIVTQKSSQKKGAA